MLLIRFGLMSPLAGLASFFFIRFYKHLAPMEPVKILFTDFSDILLYAAGHLRWLIKSKSFSPKTLFFWFLTRL